PASWQPATSVRLGPGSIAPVGRKICGKKCLTHRAEPRTLRRVFSGGFNMRSLHRLLAVSSLSLALIAAGTIPAFASDNQGDEDQDGHWIGGAPEIDPGLLGGAVALVAGGLLILRERRRS